MRAHRLSHSLVAGLACAVLLGMQARIAGARQPAPMTTSTPPFIDCGAVATKPLGALTPTEYERCARPALMQALCEAVASAARTQGCGQAALANDARCAQLQQTLISCLRDSTGFKPQPAPAR